MIVLRGGNSNPEVPNQLEWFKTWVLPEGFVSVDPNFVPVLPGQDYTYAAKGIAYLIQYLISDAARFYRQARKLGADAYTTAYFEAEALALLPPFAPAAWRWARSSSARSGCWLA